MALRLDSAALTRRFAVFFLTFNMLVNKHSDFLALFFTVVWFIVKLGLSSVISSVVDTIAASIISFRFCL